MTESDMEADLDDLELEEQIGAEITWLKWGEDIVAGDVIKGVFVEPRYKEFDNGTQTSYLIYTPTGNLYGLNGNVKLDQKMNGIVPGDFIQITYEGKLPTGKVDDEGNEKTQHALSLFKAKQSDKLVPLQEAAEKLRSKTPQQPPASAQAKAQSVQDFLASGKGLGS